jgi:hypothetical protein
MNFVLLNGSSTFETTLRNNPKPTIEGKGILMCFAKKASFDQKHCFTFTSFILLNNGAEGVNKLSSQYNNNVGHLQHQTMKGMQCCTHCGCVRPLSDFNDGSSTWRRCARCQKSNASAKKRARQSASYELTAHNQEDATSVDNLSDTIYNKLLGLEGLDDDLEGSMSFDLDFCVSLDSVIKLLSEKDISTDHDLAVANVIANAVGDGDGYSYVHKTTHFIEATKTATFSYWCNSREDMAKRRKKIEDVSKQCGWNRAIYCPLFMSWSDQH